MAITKVKVGQLDHEEGSVASSASIAGTGSSETVLMLPFDGSNNDTSTTDRSSTGHSVTFNGDAKISTGQSKFGGSSLYLDGSDHLSLADHADWTFGTDDFTWECWVRFSSVTSSGYYLFAADSDSSGFFLFRWDGGGGGSGNWSYGYTSGGNNWADTLSADTWYHVAVVRSSGDIKVYRDGVEKGSAWTHTTSLDANGGIHIGKSHSTEYMTGYIDDFRMTKGVARYTSNFTPATSSHYSAAVEGSATKHIVVDSTGSGLEEGDLKEENTRQAKAWCNFDGTGTPSIRASFNCSSITDMATGKYKVNFTTAMTDEGNYVAFVSGAEVNGGSMQNHLFHLKRESSTANILNEDYVFVASANTSATQADDGLFCVVVFGA